MSIIGLPLVGKGDRAQPVSSLTTSAHRDPEGRRPSRGDSAPGPSPRTPPRRPQRPRQCHTAAPHAARAPRHDDTF